MMEHMNLQGPPTLAELRPFLAPVNLVNDCGVPGWGQR